MTRQVDKKKTRKALRKLRRAADLAAGPDGPGLSEWEKEFVEGVSQRLETYGSAFRDPGKGRLDDALSLRQVEIVRAIDRKTRKKKRLVKPVEEPLSNHVDDGRVAAPAYGVLRPKTRKATMRSKRMGNRALLGSPDTEAGPEVHPAPSTSETPDQRRAGLRLIVGGASRGA